MYVTRVVSYSTIYPLDARQLFNLSLMVLVTVLDISWPSLPTGMVGCIASAEERKRRRGSGGGGGGGRRECDRRESYNHHCNGGE